MKDSEGQRPFLEHGHGNDIPPRPWIKTAASEIEAKLAIKYHWWVPPYLHACRLFSQITGMQPDTDKIAERIVRYGVTITVEDKQ